MEVRVRLEEENARRLLEYEAEVPDYSRTSTINLALQMFLDISEVPEDEECFIQGILAKHFKNHGYVPLRNLEAWLTYEPWKEGKEEEAIGRE